MRTFLLVLVISITWGGCVQSNTTVPSTIMAYAPVYYTGSSTSSITIETPKPITAPGKIYVFGNYLFENDINTGIHIIDITNRSAPKKLSFLNIPLSTEVAVKGNFLYTNNLSDLVVFDISNPAAPVFAKRIEGVFPLANQTYPPFTNINFECADPAKGTIIRWEMKSVNAPKCRR